MSQFPKLRGAGEFCDDYPDTRSKTTNQKTTKKQQKNIEKSVFYNSDT